MTVLVTGIGHVGGYVVRDLLAAGEDVVLYGYFGGKGDPADSDLPDLGYVDDLIGGGLRDKTTIVVGDISDRSALAAAVDGHGVHKIVHLASMISASAEANPALAVRVNVEGTANVFDVAARAGVEKVVWASTIDVFGPRSVPPSGIITDECTYDPVNVYGATKVMCEQLALRYYANTGVDITGLRLSRVYGFGEHIKLTRGGGSSWLSALLWTPMVRPAEPSVVYFGDRSMDFHYIEDVSDAFIRALGHKDGQGISYLTHGDYRRMSEAFDYVRGLLPDADLRLERGDLELPSGASASWTRRYDATRAAENIGIRSRFSMEQGLHRTLSANRVYAGLPPLPELEPVRTGSGLEPTAGMPEAGAAS